MEWLGWEYYLGGLTGVTAVFVLWYRIEQTLGVAFPLDVAFVVGIGILVVSFIVGIGVYVALGGDLDSEVDTVEE